MTEQGDFFKKEIEDREYQKKAAEVAKENCLIVLPTSLGKTVIGIEIINNEFSYGKCLFLAPTTVLVDQHVKSIKEFCKIHQVGRLTGDVGQKKRHKIWDENRIIVATPQTIMSDFSNERYDLNEVTMVIYDEAHHAVGDYDYCNIAKETPFARVVAFTASVGDSLEELKENLKIKKIFYRDKESEDVKKYVQKTESRMISVDIPREYKELEKLMRKKCGLYVDSCTKQYILLSLQSDLKGFLESEGRPATDEEVEQIKLGIPAPFKNVDRPGKKEVLDLIEFFKGKEDYRYLSYASTIMSYVHAMEILTTQDVKTFAHFLQGIPNEEKVSKAKKRFYMSVVPEKDLIIKASKMRHPKVKMARKIIENELKDSPGSKILLFANYRATAKFVAEQLKTLGIRAEHFIGKTSGKGIKGMSRKKQQEMIERFKDDVDVLVATQVAEEGIDIPEVMLNIFYEPVPNTIRYIQRFGRTGRKLPGRVIFLIAKGTSDEAIYWSTMNELKREKKRLSRLSEQ